MLVRLVSSVYAALLAVASMSAVASQVINIPASAATPASSNTDLCQAGVMYYYAYDWECYVYFPITVPVGHTIQQIAIDHETGANAPFINAFLFGIDHATQQTQAFNWISFDPVPPGTIDRHPLMQEIITPHGTAYPDAFQVAPNTLYSVVVAIQNHGVSGIEVTYN